jgi:hypothetical protein
MSKCTNLETKDAACLHILHILEYPTSRQTTNSTQSTVVNAPKGTFRHFQLADMPNRLSGRLNDVIKGMKARAAWRQKEFEPFGHCSA